MNSIKYNRAVFEIGLYYQKGKRKPTKRGYAPRCANRSFVGMGLVPVHNDYWRPRDQETSHGQETGENKEMILSRDGSCTHTHR